MNCFFLAEELEIRVDTKRVLGGKAPLQHKRKIVLHVRPNCKLRSHRLALFFSYEGKNGADFPGTGVTPSTAWIFIPSGRIATGGADKCVNVRGLALRISQLFNAHPVDA